MPQDSDSQLDGPSARYASRLAVSIVNFRTPDLVVDCLESLESEIDPNLDCAVVVDNGSGDESADRIERAIRDRGWAGWARLVRSSRNGGFSAGHNLGMCSGPAELHVLLNSDAKLRSGALAELRRAAAERPDAGIIGSRLEHPDGEPQLSTFRSLTPIGEFLAAARTGPLSRMLLRFEVVMPVLDAPAEVDWVSFACVLVRREVVEQIGEMDDDYFMYFEDVDYCRRARAAGWSALHWPAARVVHLQGKSSDVHSARETRERPPAYYYRSRSRYFAKYYGTPGLWLANCLWHAGRGIALLREVFGGKPRGACVNEWRDIWLGAASPLSSPSRDSR